MIPASFDYVAPTSVEDALAALAQHGDDAKIIAGGQSLLPVLRMRLNAPELVIDLGGIEGLRGIRDDGDAIVIGAMTTHHDVHTSDLVREHALLLTKAGQSAQRDVDTLWEHLAGRLIPKPAERFRMQAALLILAFAAASADTELPLGKIAALLTELGWRHEDGRPVAESALRHLPVYEVLTNVTDQPVTWRRRDVVSPVAAALARKALRG